PRPPRTESDFWQKGLEKCKEQPLVPLGILATCAAFIGASYQLRVGNRNSFNRYLRARVIAQGATIAACVIGGYVYGSNSQASIDRKAEER
ncbi:hypoxia induced protein conserved region-domain-containing protein, partial [Cantharellus anzutake]|uniref:hypoxia induced protein conserved region-domain-containing protein n=1 Tax=Cantharellus anzutake TaxID=1750568 RepID=UPI0019058777